MGLSFRNRRRMWRGGLALVGLALLASSVLDHLGYYGFRGNDWRRYDRQAVVIERAIHGDVLEIEKDGRKDQVQLAGIDSPGQEEFFGDIAMKYANGRAAGKTVTLRLEQLQTRDANGRLLAHVYLLDTDNLNADIVRDGLVYVDRRTKNSMRGLYEQLEAEARKRKRGLWKSVTEEQMPAWRRAWLEGLREKK